MEICPNCGVEVAGDASRCPACGLPRDLPVHDASGTVIGRTFTTIRPAGGGTVPPGPSAGTRTSWLGGATVHTAPRRSRGLTVLALALAVALVLGVAVAVVINATVLGPQRAAEPPVAPPAEGTVTPTDRSTPPGETRTTPGPSPTSPPTPTSPSGSDSGTPTAPPTVAPSAVLATVRAGLVGVVASTCSPADWSGHGGGTVIGPDLVVTAWPVVAQAVSVAVIDSAGRPVPATIHRADPSLGIAVLRTERDLSARPLTLAEVPLARGQQWYGVEADRVRGSDPAVTPVRLGSTDTTARLGRDAVTGLVQTSLPVADHLGGGAVVDGRGRLLGITARYPGRDTAVVLDTSRVSQVLAHGTTPGRAHCDTPLGPSGHLPPRHGHHPVLERYFSRINAGDYEAVWAMLAPRLRGDKKETIDGWRSSHIFNIRIRDAGNGRVRADFDSVFAPGHGPKGQTCARWSLVYRFANGQIASAATTDGGPGYTSC